MLKKIRATIIGAGGYTGRELIRILNKHQHVEFETLQSNTLKGRQVIEVYPDIPVLKKYKGNSIEECIDAKPDVMFFATPHGVALNFFPILKKNGIKGIDLSADYRFKDAEMFEKVYGILHPDPSRRVPYGLPELFEQDIKGADLVSNPGCYVTASLLASYPIKSYILSVVFDCKSGYSGSGIKKSFYNDPENYTENILAYKLTNHRHGFEIQQFYDFPIHFTPHVIPAFQGLLATCHIFLKQDVPRDEILETYRSFYNSRPFVGVTEDIPNLHQVQKTNKCILGGFELRDKRMVITSVLDNLIKGAGGQAVQNMNLMFNFPKGSGLL